MKVGLIQAQTKDIYTTRGVVIVPHVNCTKWRNQNAYFYGIQQNQQIHIMICIRKHIRSTHAYNYELYHKHTIETNICTYISTLGLIYTSGIINVQNITIIFQLCLLMSKIYGLHSLHALGVLKFGHISNIIVHPNET